MPSLREILVAIGLLTLEGIVAMHWFFYPGNETLGMVALAAGSAMCLMALAAVVLTLHSLRLNPADSQHLRELRDLAVAEPMWIFMTLTQVVFTVIVVMAGVYWVAAALVIGHGAELTAVVAARYRVRHTI